MLFNRYTFNNGGSVSRFLNAIFGTMTIYYNVINTITVEYHNYTTSQELFDALASDEIDMTTPFLSAPSSYVSFYIEECVFRSISAQKHSHIQIAPHLHMHMHIYNCGNIHDMCAFVHKNTLVSLFFNSSPPLQNGTFDFLRFRQGCSMTVLSYFWHTIRANREFSNVIANNSDSFLALAKAAPAGSIKVGIHEQQTAGMQI